MKQQQTSKPQPASAEAESAGRKAAREAIGDRAPRQAPERRNPAGMVSDVARLIAGEDVKPAPRSAPPPPEDEEEGGPFSRAHEDGTAEGEAPPRGQGEGEAEAEAEGEGQAPAEEEQKPLTWDELAAALEIEPRDLYAVTFPMADGRRVSLGELKDRLRDLEAFEGERESFNERRDTWEIGMIDARRRVAAIWDHLPEGAKDPRVTAALEAEQAADVRKHARLLAAAVPEWADPKAAEADQRAIAEEMGRFGFGAAELATIYDHRAILAMRELVKLRRQLSEGKAAARKAREQHGGRPGTGAANLSAAVTPRGAPKRGAAAVLAGVNKVLAANRRRS